MTAPARAARRQLTLRTKVLVLLLGLLAAVSAVVGVATDLALRSFLLGRLDSQLVQAGGRTAGSQGFGPGGPDSAADRVPGGTSHREPSLVDALSMQGPGTLVARRHDGAFSAYRNTDGGQTSPVTALDLGAVAALAVDGRPHALRVEGRSYRALATRSPDDDVFVTALPTAGVDATVLRLTVVELAVTGIGLLLAALAAAVLVRLTLRPLSRIAATARRVSELPLDRGEVALAERVPDADTDPGTEVGQVGPRSTACSGTWATRCGPVRRARARCGSSSPMRATSCVRRSPRSGATPSCRAAASSHCHRMSPTRWDVWSPKRSG